MGDWKNLPTHGRHLMNPPLLQKRCCSIGVTALIEVAIGLFERHINIHFGLLGLFVGPGLFRLSAIWRLVGMTELPPFSGHLV